MRRLKNPISNIIKILLILFIIQNIFTPKCKASYWSEIFDGGKSFIDTGKKATEGDDKENSKSTIDTTEIKNQMDKIYNILFSLGVALTVIIGAILGIKFIIGSADDKAQIKETLIPYVVGCIVIYGAFGIWKLVIQFFAGI